MGVRTTPAQWPSNCKDTIHKAHISINTYNLWLLYEDCVWSSAAQAGSILIGHNEGINEMPQISVYMGGLQLNSERLLIWME